MDGSLISALGVGFLLGLRHALDADHVAAVSTFVSRHRGMFRSCLVGTFWGIGHAGALLVAALTTILLRVRIPPQVDRVLEGLVAVLVIVLGADMLVQALRSVRVHRHEHAHGGRSHRHVHVHVGAPAAHSHVHIIREGKRPLVTGALHGLAGSAALLLLVLTTIPSTVAALVYVAVFSVGSTVGMVIVSGLIGIPFAVGGRDGTRLVVQIAAGVASLGVGIAMLRPVV